MEKNKQENKVNLVFLRHFRRYMPRLRSLKNPKGLVSTGGLTIVCIEKEGKLAWGAALCCDSDVFSRKLGRVKSIGRC